MTGETVFARLHADPFGILVPVLVRESGVIVLAEPEGRAQPRPEDQPASPTGTPVGDVFLSFEIGRECRRRSLVQGTVRTRTALARDLALDIRFAGDADQPANVVFQ